MKTQKLKRMMSLFLAALICVTTLSGSERLPMPQRKPTRYALFPFPVTGTPTTAANGGTAALIL